MRWHRILLAVLLLLTTVCAASAQPKRVLLLHSYGRDFAPWSAYARTMREELGRQSTSPLDIVEASLATARTADDQEGPFVDYLRALFANRKLDLIITLGAPAAGFVQRHRQRLFPAIPALFTVLDQRRIALGGGLTPNDTAVSTHADFAVLVENLLQVRPQTKNIVIMFGDSPLERFWLQQFIDELKPLEKRVTFSSFRGLSFEEMLEHAARLPPDSAILLGLLLVDAAGVSYEEERAMARLHAAANAPVFSHADVFFGRGLLGGPMTIVADVSRESAAAAVRLLGGEAPSSVKIPPIGFGTPKYDWRELKRWDISEARLPPGSEIHFREPTLWEQYRWQLIAILSAILLQAAVISVLLFERRRRSLAEIESGRRRREVIHLNRVATASVLSSSIAHELNQPLGAILINTETAQQMLRVVPPDLGQIGEILSDIVRDDHRANEILQRQGNLFKKEKDGNLKILDLNNSVQQVMNIAGPEASKRGVVLSVSQTSEPLPVRSDEIQMQQVILNLVMNGMDSLGDRDASARKLAIETSRNGKALAKVTVSDSGKGIPEDKLTTIFEAFFTTKPNGTGLGLPIARTIVQAHGGSIWAENGVGGGAAFHFTLPLADAP